MCTMASGSNFKQRSTIKNFITEAEDDSKAVCKFCKLKIGQGSNHSNCNTSNLLKHLNTTHDAEFST